METISNVQGDFFGESDMDYENRRNRPRHRREDAAQVPHFHAPPTIVGSSVWSRRTEAFGCSNGGCGPNRDSIASAQASEARHQSVQARAFRCRAGTDVVAKDVEGGGRKRQSVTAAAQQMILFILSKTGSRGDRVGQRCAVKSAVGLVSTQPSTRSKNL